MIEALFGALKSGADLLVEKEKNNPIALRIQRDINEWQGKWRDEYNKPIGVRSDAVLDNLQFKLCQLGREFTAAAQSQNTALKS